MNLQQLTSTDLIFTQQDFGSKKEIINFLSQKMQQQGYLSDADDFVESVWFREKLGETGFENGFAIPHGKSTAVKKAGVAILTLKNPLPADEWESIDPNNKVQLVILLAIPDSEAGDTHLKVLSEWSVRLMDHTFVNQLKQLTSAQAIYDLIGTVPKKERTSTDNQVSKGKYVLGVTACATGIAHTYMAAEALEKAAREMQVTIHIEKQGANGLENKITPDMVAKADGVIFAVDTKIKEKDRFAGLPYVEVKVAEPLKRGKELIKEVLEKPTGVVSGTVGASEDAYVGGSLKDTLSAAIMTGISYMIPVLVAGGLMLGIAKLTWVYALGLDAGMIGDISYNTSGGITQFLHYLDSFGGLVFKFVYPIFAMYTSYAIADRGGLVSGFVGGLFAAGLHYTFWGVEGGIPSGFLGALVLGVAAGFVSKFLNEKIKLSKNLSAMKPMFLIPGLSVLFIFLLNMFIVDSVFGQLNLWMANTIKGMSGSGELTLSAIIAAATAFDLGGPVNKAAGAIAIGMAADNVFPLTPRVLAIVIPPLGLGLATMIDRFVVKRRVFPEDLRVVGGTSFLLGFLAISEGAIPFMLRNPLITIPLNIIGAVIGACTAVALGAIQWLPLPAIWGWPLVENLGAYLIGLILGVLFIAFSNIFIRYALIKRNEKNE